MTPVADLQGFRRWMLARAPAVAFAGPDPHYALGLDELVPGLRLACAEDVPACDLLRGAGRAVWTPPGGAPAAAPDGDEPEGAATDGEARRSAAAVLADPRAAAFVGGPGTAVVVFKVSHELERLAAARGWRLVAAPAALSRRWENKVAFLDLAAAAGVRLPDAVALDLADADHASLAARLGPVFVLQAAHGYAGNRSVRVAGPGDLARARRGLRARRVRATAWVEGAAMTVNACVTAGGVAVAAPFEQVTGLPALTPYPLGSCGQCWAADVEGAGAMVAAATALGRALAGDGYRGFFGVDFVVAPGGDVRVIEVNPRLVASVAAFTQLELLAGRLPLLARHLLAWLDPEADVAPLDAHRAPLAGGQLVVHNVADAPARLRGPVAAGVYDALAAGPPRWLRSATHLAEVPGDGEILVLPASHALPIPAHGAWARVQARTPLAAPGGALVPAASALVDWLQGWLAPA